MDVTLRGPVLSKRDIYAKYTSLFSPVSFLNLIRGTYPDISTGVIREFRAIEGEFEGGASLGETLEGDINVAMLVYKNAERAIQLFSVDYSSELGPAVPSLASFGDYKVNQSCLETFEKLMIHL